MAEPLAVPSNSGKSTKRKSSMNMGKSLTRVPQELWRLIHDIHKIEEDAKEPVFIVLLTGDETRKIREHRDKLLSSFRPHHLRNGQEVVFYESNIVINIIDTLYSIFIYYSGSKELVQI
jgi:hypothetical protein